MTFGDLIKTINTSKAFGYTRNDLASNLLQAAGIKVSGDNLDTTVVKWIDRNVPDKINSYFEDAKVNEGEILKFFRDQIRCPWKELQSAFSKSAKCDKVDCYTNDQDEFYQSLLEELIISLGLPLPEEPPTKQMFKIYKRTFQKCCIQKFIECDPTIQLDFDLTGEVENFIEIIKSEIMFPFFKQQDEELYMKIAGFTEILNDYNNYLSIRMIPLADIKGVLVPLHREEDMPWEIEFGKRTLCYRRKMADVYKEILCSGDK